MKARGPRAVAIAATVGNLLQGWDAGAVAGAMLYLKPDLHLEADPTLEGFVVASTLVGAVASTTTAGPAADWLGRRTMLSVSAFLFSVSACVMAWSPDVHVLIVGRILAGCGMGLVATISPILIAESAPTEIRGQLATFPQFMGTGGQFLALIIGFLVSLTATPNWRFMLGILLAPSLLYLFLCIFVVPESPRWLVMKGQMLTARKVLQDLRGREDVNGELALLVEGLGVGVDGKLEEWRLEPADQNQVVTDSAMDEGKVVMFGPEDGITWIATPMGEEGESTMLARSQSVDMTLMDPLALVDPMVTLVGSFQVPYQSVAESHDELGRTENDDWDDENIPPSPQGVNGRNGDEFFAGDMDENLQTPLLLSRQTSVDKKPRSLSRGNSINLFRHGSTDVGNTLSRSVQGSSSLADTIGDVGIGGGWQLAWRYTGQQSGDPADAGSLQRVYIFKDQADPSQFGSALALPGLGPISDGEAVQASVLVAPSAQLVVDNILVEDVAGPAVVHPSETANQGPAFKDLAVPGVRRALIVGTGLQVLQQLCGINAVLYFIPQIIQQSGADTISASMGVGPETTSIFASVISSLVMLPCIFIAMRLMDRSGRRQLLLGTLPVLSLALMVVVIANIFLKAGVLQALTSFAGLSLFLCAFVMGFGPIPNILCSEIFPTRVRGICIGICSASMWLTNILVTYSFPLLNSTIGLPGVFSIFLVISLMSWVFVFIKVPETKGMPLEVISEFFALSAVIRKGPDTTDLDTTDGNGKV